MYNAYAQFLMLKYRGRESDALLCFAKSENNCKRPLCEISKFGKTLNPPIPCRPEKFKGGKMGVKDWGVLAKKLYDVDLETMMTREDVWKQLKAQADTRIQPRPPSPRPPSPRPPSPRPQHRGQDPQNALQRRLEEEKAAQAAEDGTQEVTMVRAVRAPPRDHDYQAVLNPRDHQEGTSDGSWRRHAAGDDGPHRPRPT